MNGYAAFLKKELTENMKNYRFLILFAVFLIFGLASPFLAKFMPEILSAVAADMQMGSAPVALDAWEQFYKNISGVGFSAFIILFGSCMDGEDSKGRVISRSVAQDRSEQVFYPRMVGNAQCFGNVQCDSIIMGEAKIKSIPAITANCTEAQLVHEAAIGKIAGDQLLKLETLGLTEEEAEDCILKGFLA